jgi:hypothetical protein
MGQIDVDFLGCQLQVHGGHAPGAFDAQDAPVKFTIFHRYWMAIHAVGVHGPASERAVFILAGSRDASSFKARELFKHEDDDTQKDAPKRFQKQIE